MRFSDTPMWWRLLVIAVTLAICWGLYAITAWIVGQMPNSVLIPFGIVFFTMIFVGLIAVEIRDRRSAKRKRVGEHRRIRQ